MKKISGLAFRVLITFLFVTIFMSPAASAEWGFEVADSTKSFSNFYDRAIAIDKVTNQPHIVYGSEQLYHAWFDGAQWHYETVDSTPGVGSFASIAIDSNNKVHISYHNEAYDDLKYATNASGSWVISTIDYTGGDYTSIAVDSANKVHISYYDLSNADLKYATNASGTWVTSIVDSSGDVGRHTSIVLDSNNKVHISYVDDTYDNLKYATNASGSWVTSTIDSSGSVGYFSSIAADSNNKIHISYFDDTSDDLKYATNVSGSWITSIIDSAGDKGRYSSITVDSNNNAHIGYLDRDGSDLKYATNASGTWVTSIIDSSDYIGGTISIATDANNEVHISYVAEYPKRLKYATNISGSWVTSMIDSSYGLRKFSSVALDSGSKAHISYYDDSNEDLKYATNISGSWVTSTIDSSGGVGKFSSIALDSGSKAHISYYDDSNEDLKYATNASGSWVISTIDSTGYVGQYSSIAVDSNNKVHISYYDYTHGDLKYATNASGSWVISTIDSTGYVGQYSSIALDSNNKVHISYYDLSNTNLKYATNASGSWVVSVIDSSGYVGTYTSIALDSNDKVHISYYNNSSHSIMYATNASGSWVTSTIDSNVFVGNSSITIDGNNNVHISYVNNGGGYLKYVTNSSGSWVTLMIDSGGTFASIAVDTYNFPHISYSDLYGNLTYASFYPGSDITVSPDRINFGTVLIGTFSEQTMTVQNDGDEDLIIGNIAQTNPVEGPFSIVEDNCSGFTLAPGASCTLTIRFEPVSVLFLSDTFDIPSNDSNENPVIVDLNGRGEIPVPDISVTSVINFGYVISGMSSEWTLTVGNSGDGDLIIGNISQLDPSEPPFSIISDNCSGFTVEPGESCTLTVVFKPEAEGNYSDTFDIPSNDPDENPVIVNLTGSGFGPPPVWRAENVDNEYIPYYENYSLSVDSSHKAHIAYFREGIRYATNISSYWKNRQVASGDDYASLAVDSSDNIHICFTYDYTNGYTEIRYATNKSGQWLVNTIDGGWGCSIAMDSADNAHISYLSRHMNSGTYVYETKYATNASGLWLTEAVDSLNAKSSSIAVDVSGNVHIVIGTYSSNPVLTYITNKSGAWETTQLDSGGSTIVPAIDLDSSGNVHIAYSKDYGPGVGVSDLVYATNASGYWNTEILDDQTRIPYEVTINLDSNDNVFIGYCDDSNGRLNYFTNETGVWSTETLVNEGAGRYFSFEIDSLDNMHVAFMLNGLKYMTNAPVPDIDANGSDSQVTLNDSDPVSLTIELSPNDSLGKNAESWILAEAGSGWYHYDMDTQNWLPGQAVSDQGALYELGPVDIPTVGLPSGHYTFYYVVDFTLNGYLDITDSYFDSVEVYKTQNDWYAVDVTLAPHVASISVDNDNLPDLSASEFTIEAWVKSKTDNLNGNIFSRFHYMGAALSVDNNVPKLTIGNSATHSTSTSRQFVVSGSESILKNIWTHIAAVLVNQNHQSVHASCNGAEAETPHMDIYINGEFKNCASTDSGFADNPPQYNRIDMAGDSRYSGFDGVLDEVRFWSVARTQAEIQQCMTAELNNSGGACDNSSSILKGYWRFNEGSGSEVYDSSGHGYHGVKRLELYSIGDHSWDDGWVPGYHYSSDEDGDGVPANKDCDDYDPMEYPGQTWYQDFDNDGYPDGTTSISSCERPTGFKVASELVSLSPDCDDYDPLERPGQTWYLDGDNDGYSDGTVNTTSCERPQGYKVFSELLDISIDCDDSNAALNPETLWYADNDGDGFGNPAAYVQQCSQFLNFVLNNIDCDDNDANIYPGGPQVRIVDSPYIYFDTLQEAYLAALTSETDIIQLKGTRPESVNFNLDKSVIIDGGYDCSFTKTQITIFYGNIVITNGVVTIGDVDLR